LKKIWKGEALAHQIFNGIHLNLLRAGLVKDITELSQSPWSGHSALMGKVKRDWQKTGYVLSFKLSNGNLKMMKIRISN
jgi:hypothetical protein